MPNGWFGRGRGEERRPPRQAAPAAAEVPEGLWTKCPKCHELLFVPDLERNQKVCPKCEHHLRLTAGERIELLVDPGSFVERDALLHSGDPLEFQNYPSKLKRHQEASGLTDAILAGSARVEEVPVALAVTDSRFMMGSMGSVVGERLTRIMEYALETHSPVILVSGSGGGARMEEGLLSLMQMPKTSAAIARLNRAGVPVFTLLTDPTMGGVAASWAWLGDVILAEPGASIGFAGLRVSQQAQVNKPPADFQTAEWQMKHGMIDLIVPRKELRATLARLIAFATPRPAPVEAPVG